MRSNGTAASSTTRQATGAVRPADCFNTCLRRPCDEAISFSLVRMSNAVLKVERLT
ncbi:MAG: hypothetical protein JWO08_482 [Verrucomicrobiaceae bacterium]|nr:hypothetical protein [Verrucomicrobiaceae bacterium]